MIKKEWVLYPVSPVVLIEEICLFIKGFQLKDEEMGRRITLMKPLMDFWSEAIVINDCNITKIDTVVILYPWSETTVISLKYSRRKND